MCFSVCVEESKRKREEGVSLEFGFQQCSVSKAHRSKFAVDTTSKLCPKIATVRGATFSGKSRLLLMTTRYRNVQEMLNLHSSISNKRFLNLVELL